MKHRPNLAPPVLAALILTGLGSLTGCATRSSTGDSARAATPVGDQEQVVTLAQVPAPVRAAIESTVANGKVGEIEFDRADGIYEVEFLRDGREFEADITASGEVRAIERSIRIDELPEPVRVTVIAESKGGEVTDLSEIKRMPENRVRYEAEIARGQELIVLEIGPRGRVLDRSVEKREADKPATPPAKNPATRY